MKRVAMNLLDTSPTIYIAGGERNKRIPFPDVFARKCMQRTRPEFELGL